MKIIMDEVLPPGGPIGFEVAQGQHLRLYQTEGQQVADVLSFSRADPSERMSMYMSFFANDSWTLSESSVLVGTRGNELWRVEVDTVGENYLGGGFCNRYSNLRSFGVPGEATCLANLNMAGEEFGLQVTEYEGDTCLNIFMRVEYREDGAIVAPEPSSRPGDEFVLEALVDQIVLLSNCPQSRNNTNARRPKTLGVQVLGG